MTCSTCRHSRPAILDNEDGELEPALECWRYPPLGIALGGEIVTFRPQVTEVDTCGEHEPVS